MELPFIVVFEPPSRTELRALLRMRRTRAAGLLVVLAIGIASLLATSGHTDAVASDAGVALELASHPAGAAIWLDGHERGSTPLSLYIAPGPHTVLVKAPDAVDGEYTLQVGDEPSALEAVLWRREPKLMHLRPPLPGATLADARLLADGAVGLSIALPPGRQMQAWRLDPRTGVLESLTPELSATRLAVAPDGQRVAFVGFEMGPPSAASSSNSMRARASVLWLASGDRLASNHGWRPSLANGEELVDASWSPSGDRLLAVSDQDLPGGATSSRLWLVDADGQTGRQLLSLPSGIAAGSEGWSPDGEHVALVAHAGTVNALCLVDMDGGFRYVADLEASQAPPAFLPAAWAADGQQLLFTAPHQPAPGVALGWPQPDPQRALYVAHAGDPTLRLAGDTDVDFAAEREAGQVVGLGRLGSNHALALRLMDGGSSARRLVELPLHPAPTYAAAWDLVRARLLLATPSASGGLDYWLAMLGLEDES